MAGTIGRQFIEKFVLKKLAEKSGRRTGITTIRNVKDPQVQFNIEEVRKTIESLGMSPNDVKSVAEIEKIMNIRKAISDQTLKNKFKNLGLDKGVDDLAKKPPFQGFTPTIVGKPPKGNINYTAMEEKFGFPLRGNESLSELAKIERIGRDEYYNMLASRAMNIRRRMSKVDAEGGTEIGYQEFNKLQEELDGLNDFITRVQKEIPEDMASGGLARVGYAGGKLVKGAPWVINKLKEQLFDMDLGIGGSTFSKLTSTQKDFYKKELNTLIKQLEQGGEIPKEMLDTMIADPKFKSVVKTRSTDKDLFELEGALLDRQAGKQADQIVDDVFGPFDADGKLNKKAVLQEVKDAEEKMLLDKFDVKDRMKNASGGRASRGLNYLLGEDDQNVRTPYQGGLPGLLGE